WTGSGVVAGFVAVVLIKQWPHGKKGDGRWSIRLLQTPQELSLIDKTRNQLFCWRHSGTAAPAPPDPNGGAAMRREGWAARARLSPPAQPLPLQARPHPGCGLSVAAQEHAAAVSPAY